VARPRSLTLPLEVDRAGRRHVCQHNNKHVIVKGDLRLKITVGRSHEHYCAACATRFIDLATQHLGELRREVNKPRDETATATE
jgi:hypothetical protein